MFMHFYWNFPYYVWRDVLVAVFCRKCVVITSSHPLVIAMPFRIILFLTYFAMLVSQNQGHYRLVFSTFFIHDIFLHWKMSHCALRSCEVRSGQVGSWHFRSHSTTVRHLAVRPAVSFYPCMGRGVLKSTSDKVMAMDLIIFFKFQPSIRSYILKHWEYMLIWKCNGLLSSTMGRNLKTPTAHYSWGLFRRLRIYADQKVF